MDAEGIDLYNVLDCINFLIVSFLKVEYCFQILSWVIFKQMSSKNRKMKGQGWDGKDRGRPQVP